MKISLGDSDEDNGNDDNIFLSFSKALSHPMLMIFVGMAIILGTNRLREEISLFWY